MAAATRIEHDFLGELAVPAAAYYGIQTLRASENFRISGIKMHLEPSFIEAFALVKKAAARANVQCGVLDLTKAAAIEYACDQLLSGNYHDQFITDLIQGGAGTSVNMNANEVIANIGLEHMGYAKGDYDHLHPNNHVNASQSTNDAYPTAIHLALFRKVDAFIEALRRLQEAFRKKATEFSHVLKMGRTQLQDAVPMTLGQEFDSFAVTIGEDIRRMESAQKLLTDVNMGGTAIGTGLNAPNGYAKICVAELGQLSGIPVVLAEDLIEASSDMGDYVEVSAALKRSAVKISKICNDLRLLSSGPRAGLAEINLPKMQPGSSIMPGKVNPVIPEVVNQTAFYVIGADLTVTIAAEAGQLQLNVMEPVIAFSMFTSFTYFTNAIHTLVELCITGITANEERCRDYVMGSIGIVTALNPILGYETSAAIAKEALASGKVPRQIVVEERKLLTPEQWDAIYTVENMVHPDFSKQEDAKGA
ncbi:MAG: aspartate ammonia-lyase [Sphingobacteriales bacterium]|nr:MAG: aspartate ammonia-lyase [Sphingobacteriales bacterium]